MVWSFEYSRSPLVTEKSEKDFNPEIRVLITETMES